MINPAALDEVMPRATWEEYMWICMELMEKAEALVQLPGWEKSRGAQREYGYALAKEMDVYKAEYFED